MLRVKKNIIAFIPARSGSKSLINKNLKKINNQNGTII
jgi:CMP-N-acetylneuraminic acid synthetase